MRTESLAHPSLNKTGGNFFMNPETGLASLSEEMDRVFDRFTNLFDPFLFRTSRNEESRFLPHIDITKRDESFQVIAEFPGMEGNDLKVSWSDGFSTLKGEKKSSYDQESTSFYCAERTYGKFERRISVSVEIDSDKVSASFKNGVLTVTLPKSQEAKTQIRKIAVSPE